MDYVLTFGKHKKLKLEQNRSREIVQIHCDAGQAGKPDRATDTKGDLGVKDLGQLL